MPPVQLATNVQDQESKLAAYVNAKAQVAGYVAALQNTDLSGVSFTDLPPDLKLPGDPKTLLATVKTNLATAKQHGQNWSNNIQPNLTNIPQAIINYGTTFQSTMTLMTPLLTDLFANPNDTQSRKEVMALFQGLLTAIGDQQTALAAEMTLLQQFNTDVTTDHGNFSSGNNQFAAIVAVEEADLKTLNDSIMSLNSLISTLNKAITIEEIALGVSSALVVGGAIGLANAETGVGLIAGGASIVVGLVGIGVSAHFLVESIMARQAAQQQENFDKQEVDALTVQIQALNTAEMALGSLVTQSVAAMAAVQVILDTWATLGAKITAVVNDLNNSETNIGSIVSLVDLNTANTQWGQLQTFADQMQGFESTLYAAPTQTITLPPMNVKVKPVPTSALVARRRPASRPRRKVAAVARKGARP